MIRIHHDHDFPAGLSSPDVYFTPGYGRAACVTENGQWVLLEAFDGAWQMPLILRTLVDGTKDAISPYGYSGIYASESLSSAQIHQAWAATVARLRELGVISVLLRHSPLVTQAPPDLPGLRSIVSGHSTFVLEPVDTDTAWTDLDKHCRNKVRKALKNGYTGHVRRAEGEDIARGSDFRRLYEQTMQRVDAAPHYVFGDEYYQRLIAGLGSNLFVAEVRDHDDAVVASGLRMLHGDRLHAHLAGSNSEDARMGTNNLMMWVTTQFILDHGLRQFHIGGGVQPDDNLNNFKRSFGGRELEFRVSGLIIGEDAYDAQVERRAKALETTAVSVLASGYFPAYRGRIA